ncbi:MAG: lysophospholipase [Herbaspirillum sp.]|nr:lysophospholipase [Herbaspirillum sp.]
MAVMTERFLRGADGVALFCREWTVPGARGAVQIVHGLGEHGGRYAELAAIFNALGLSVLAYDHRGHGRSGGARGSMADRGDFLRDLGLVFDDYSRAQNTTPFLFGHSLGGLIAVRFATGGLGKVRGLMLSSPALAFRLSRFQRLLLAVGSALAPGLAIGSGLPPHGISHDEEVLRRSLADTLSHGKVAPRVVRFMLNAIDCAMADAHRFTEPVLMQFAGNDLLVDPAGSARFFARLPDRCKTMFRYDDAYHEIFNESEPLRGAVQRDLIGWLETQLD